MKMIKFSSPWFSILAFYFLFVGGETLYYAVHNYDYPYFSQAAQDTVVAFSIPMLMWLGLFIYSKRRKVIEILYGQIESTKIIYSSSVGCSIDISSITRGVFFSIFILLSLGIVNGVNPISDPLSFRQVIQGGGNSYFLLLFLFFYKLYGVCYFERVYLGIASLRYHVYALLVILFCFISGFTSLFMHMFISGLLYLNVRYSFRVFRPSVVIGFLALVVVTPFYTVVRELKKAGVEVDMSVISSQLEKMDVDPFKIFVDRFDYFDNFVAGSHFARLYQDPAKLIDFFYQPLPRSLFPDKAYNFSTTMTGYVYPANLDIGVTANFGFINEFILYFGDFGPVIAGVFLAFLTLLTYRVFVKAGFDGRTGALYSVVILPYFMSFPIGYYNDMGLPALILNLLFWHFFAKNKSDKLLHDFRKAKVA